MTLTITLTKLRISSVRYLQSLLLACIFHSQLALADDVYLWSVVPQFSATAVHRDWSPLLTYLEGKTGYKFKLKTYDVIPDFETGFLQGVPDFAYMNPYHAVMANEALGYEPIVRNGTRLLTGIIVVRKDSEVNDIQTLDGEKIAFPAPNAFAASLYMRALLREREGLVFTPVYFGNHSNAYRQTLLGHTAASGTVKRTLLKESKYVQDGLKILYETPGRAPHPIAVHQRVPNAVKLAVQDAIIELGDTEEGRAILKPIFLLDPVKADFDVDYLPLKELGLDKYFIRH